MTRGAYRESRYVDWYLDAVVSKPVTPSTFMYYQLQGNARQYMERYTTALIRSLERRRGNGTVEKISSVGGGVAYRRVSDRDVILDC